MMSTHRPCCWLFLFLTLGILIGHFLPFPLIYWLWASVILIILNWIPASNCECRLIRPFAGMTWLNNKIWPLYAAIFCLGAALIHVAHPPAMEPLHDWQVQLKQSFYQYLDPDEAGTMSAIVLGDRGQIPKEIKISLQRSGTGHIVVTAGLHCAMMTTIVIFVLKFIRIPRLLQGWLSILLIFTYALLTGGSIPVIRAAFTASVLLASYIFELESDALNSLCAAALLILLMNADNLFDTSFQLSFAAVAAIILLCKPLEEMLSFLPRWLAVALAVSTSAWVGITPVQLWHFGTITPIALIANLFIVPLLDITVALGLCLALAGLWAPSIAWMITGCVKAIFNLMVVIAFWFANIPFGYLQLWFVNRF